MIQTCTPLLTSAFPFSSPPSAALCAPSAGCSLASGPSPTASRGHKPSQGHGPTGGQVEQVPQPQHRAQDHHNTGDRAACLWYPHVSGSHRGNKQIIMHLHNNIT